MKLSRVLASVDLETTSLDVQEARIIEMGIFFLNIDGSIKGGSRRFNPGIPIPPESTVIHGITDEIAKDCPPFSEYAKRVMDSLKAKDLLFYNGRSLDLPVIDAELRRCGLRLDLTPDQRIIDSFSIFRQKAPRDLAAAVRTYAGREHDGAHGAGDDARATIDVFLGQLRAHEDLDAMTLDELAVFCRGTDLAYVGWEQKFYRDAEGDLCFAFGKHWNPSTKTGIKVKSELGYARWMLSPKATFTDSTLEIIEEELKRLGL